jgi:hypothetical protein
VRFPGLIYCPIAFVVTQLIAHAALFKYLFGISGEDSSEGLTPENKVPQVTSLPVIMFRRFHIRSVKQPSHCNIELLELAGQARGYLREGD